MRHAGLLLVTVLLLALVAALAWFLGRPALAPVTNAARPKSPAQQAAQHAAAAEELDAEPAPMLERPPADAPPKPKPEPKQSADTRLTLAPATLSLFDGRTLSGWKPASPWSVDAGEILCPTTKDLVPNLVAMPELTRPFEISVEVQLVGRGQGDARSLCLTSGTNAVELRLDDKPDQFQVRVNPRTLDENQTTPLQEGVWYRLWCSIQADGVVHAKLDGRHAVTTTWQGTLPVKVELSCQRSGGRFRNLVVRYL